MIIKFCKKAFCLLFCLLVFGACARPSPTPGATPTLAPQANTAKALFPGPENSALFPAFYTENSHLLSLSVLEGSIVSTQLAQNFSLYSAGHEYSFFYYNRAEDALYYSADLYLHESLVYGSLFLYTKGQKTLLARDVLVASIRQQGASLLYTVNNSSEAFSLYHFTQGQSRLIDDLVYTAFFISETEYVYLKDLQGRAAIAHALVLYPRERVLANPRYDYSLLYRNPAGENVLIGYAGPLFGIDLTERRIAYIQSAETEYLQDGAQASYSVSVYNLLSKRELVLGGVILPNWAPQDLYGPWHYLMGLDYTRQDRAAVLYRVDEHEPESVETGVTSFFYPDNSAELAVFAKATPTGILLGATLHSGTRYHLPPNLKTPLSGLTAYSGAGLVYALSREGNLYRFYLGGEIQPALVAGHVQTVTRLTGGILYGVCPPGSLSADIYYLPNGGQSTLVAAGAVCPQGRAAPLGKVRYNPETNTALYFRARIDEPFYDLCLWEKGTAAVVLSPLPDAFSAVVSPDLTETLFAFGGEIYYTYNGSQQSFPFAGKLLGSKAQ